MEMYYDEADIPSLDLFECAPKLQEVFVNPELWNFTVTMQVPWPQLLKYGGSNTWNGHLDALRSGSNLVECTLEVASGFGPLGPRVLLPRLLRLSLSDTAFLTSLETPALLELHCDADSTLPSFFYRVPCQLQKLGLGVLENTDVSGLITIINAIPTITYLGIVSKLPAELLHELCATPNWRLR
ncbi:hypothetical protein B0H17DRAFT_1196644 [Mycena rosella]|uniref:Uncharacterized protein n=1 Tax=Mycena rosella TaxID=1033263 RepID=A0AAD7GQ32_MYCRO|nr:hypothetical protein B0H17DRAFT_1196644 [Mycena rosella]